VENTQNSGLLVLEKTQKISFVVFLIFSLLVVAATFSILRMPIWLDFTIFMISGLSGVSYFVSQYKIKLRENEIWKKTVEERLEKLEEK